ncbi:MAG: hypothetical protein HND58_04700 [Planctomycetota bacterium]|nr:MAG: hypothetical protein HND58_04700 [Planctomycetota bacterium]
MSQELNAEAARVVREATDTGNPLPADLEAAWAEWIKGIQGIDERALTLLRAAFEAGAGTVIADAAADLGRRGRLKGGKARAEVLTEEQRQEFARKAAEARWKKP